MDVPLLPAFIVMSFVALLIAAFVKDGLPNMLKATRKEIAVGVLCWVFIAGFAYVGAG